MRGLAELTVTYWGPGRGPPNGLRVVGKSDLVVPERAQKYERVGRNQRYDLGPRAGTPNGVRVVAKSDFVVPGKARKCERVGRNQRYDFLGGCPAEAV